MRYLVFILLSLTPSLATAADPLRLNQIQFVGSHNSYKKLMLPEHHQALEQRNPEAALSLDYVHLPLTEQLGLGIRKLELDVFVRGDNFVVGHVQDIDMQSHCSALEECLRILKRWSSENPSHVPIWVSFNAKDQPIESLSLPAPFDDLAFTRLDKVLQRELSDRLISPRDVKTKEVARPNWPTLDAARGKFLLILDEGGAKAETYLHGWRNRPMFVSVEPSHPAAAVMVINDPIGQFDHIQQMVKAGYLVRTRADADTAEARRNDTIRRDAAFASGAHAVSTDYYITSTRFDSAYTVTLPGRVVCNPVNTTSDCAVSNP